MRNAALAIIQDEHRSLMAVLDGLSLLTRQMIEGVMAPDFRLLWAMTHYIDAFPEQLHHPKEDAYLFSLLRQRTEEADAVVEVLSEQHRQERLHVSALEDALQDLEGGEAGTAEAFACRVNAFVTGVAEHIRMEESILMPLAIKHLHEDDWAVIADAFGSNGDPRFGSIPDQEFRTLFSRIADWAGRATAD